MVFFPFAYIPNVLNSCTGWESKIKQTLQQQSNTEQNFCLLTYRHGIVEEISKYK